MGGGDVYEPVSHRRSTPALEARDVSVRRCGHSLVQRVSITVDHGELLVLLGGLGSGSTTLVEVLAGRLAPDAGRVLVAGRTPLGLADEAAPRVQFASGAHACGTVLDQVAEQGRVSARVVLLDRPTAGLDIAATHRMLRRCREVADAGRGVVVTLESADLAATYATTIALFVAGRLLSWGSPAVALVPALQLLGGDVGRGSGVSRGSVGRGSAAHRPGG